MNITDPYIQQFEPKVQTILVSLRNIVFEIAPEAIESISYGMPAYKINQKPLVYFAAYAKHIGLYATPSAHTEFKLELANYKQGKGSVQFPLNQEIPYELIKKIIEYKYKELTSKKN